EALPDLLQDVLGEIELLIDEQLSAYQIGERLYESGIRTRHGKERWGSGTLVNLMRNPVYTGLYHYNKRQHVPAKRRNMPGAVPVAARSVPRADH
ncbi:MAG TPA: recombinase family protein, partial [Blastocatellia bacterium]|nr:recombinase family protein [Blastocatellia bacterium]